MYRTIVTNEPFSPGGPRNPRHISDRTTENKDYSFYSYTNTYIQRGINKFPQGVTQPKDRGGPISLSVRNVDIYQTEQQKIKIIPFTHTQIHTC